MSWIKDCKRCGIGKPISNYMIMGKEHRFCACCQSIDDDKLYRRGYPWECDICNRKFKKKHHVKWHKQAIHRIGITQTLASISEA